MGYVMKNDIYICDTHRKIKEQANKLKELKNCKELSLSELHKSIDTIADLILNMAEEASLAGQSMEDRLICYRKAIEGLGFERVR